MEIKLKNSILQLVQGDITKETTDAIVNAANSQLSHGGGVAAAIASAAGSQLRTESRELGNVPTGSVAVTSGGNLEVKYVIHAVGPVWKGGNHNEEELLASCILRSIEKAVELNLASISFPAISTGIYGYPLDEAAEVMLHSALDWMNTNNNAMTIRFVLFSQNDFQAFENTLTNLKSEYN